MSTTPARDPADEEFSLPGTRGLGCVLIHGFTATPDEMRPLGAALAARGFPVRGVRLAGHGTSVEDLARTGRADWIASAEAGCAALARDVERIALVGMSLGALLALHLAATRPTMVDALVLCGTPLRLPPRVRLLPLAARLSWVARRLAVIPKRNGLPDIADPAVRAASHSYRAMPLAAVLELLRLQAVVARELARVTQPALLLHGRDDHSVPLANLALLRAGIGSRDVETHVLARSWHVVTLDYDRDEVTHLVGDFLERIEATPARQAAR